MSSEWDKHPERLDGLPYLRYNKRMTKAVTKRTCKIVQTVYGYAFLALTLVVLALFIWQVAEIVSLGIQAGYEGGQGSYTREIVGERLKRISPALWLWLASVVAGFILWEVFPVESMKTPYRDPRYTLTRLTRKMPAVVGDGLKEEYEAYSARKRVLKIAKICCAALSAGVAVYVLVYLCLPSSFSVAANATEEVLRMVKFLFPAIFASFFACIAFALYETISAKRILPTVKKLAAAGGEPEKREESAFQRRVHQITRAKWFLPAVRITVIVTACVLIITGIFTGNMSAVFRKAVNICTECIGLG